METATGVLDAPPFPHDDEDVPAVHRHPSRGWRRRRARPDAGRLRHLAAAVITALILLGGCTVNQSQHYQVDVVATGYHFHLYRTTSMMIWWAHSSLCGWAPECTLQKVRDQAQVNGIFGAISGLDFFFDDDVQDFNEALIYSVHPWPLSINLPEQYGCLGGYKNLIVPHSDGDWYSDWPDKPWCLVGSAL